MTDIREQFGVVPYRGKGEHLEVLLVTSMGEGWWIFPKGGLEPDLSASESAAKEAFEEAGVTGVTHDTVMSEYSYEKGGRINHVVVYPLEVTEVLEEWDEMDRRRRKWCTLPEAIEAVPVQDLKNILAALPDFLAG